MMQNCDSVKVALQQISRQTRELSESSNSSELFLSVSNSPEPQNANSANSSVYYSLCDTTPEDLSGAESETSLDVTVYLQENCPGDIKTPSNSVNSALGLVTPVNSSRSHKIDELCEPLCSSSFIETATNSVEKHFDKTFPIENTVILKEKQNRPDPVAESAVDLLGEEEFVSSDLVNFAILPKSESPLRRDTFSIGLVLKNLPADENILKPATFAFEAQPGAILPVASNCIDKSCENDATPVNHKFSQDLLIELEDPLLDKTVSAIDDSFFGAQLETNEVETAKKTKNSEGDEEVSKQKLEKLKEDEKVVRVECEEKEKMATEYDDDFDFNSIPDPFKSANKMMADSPPLPRRNVEMNYDDIDYDAIENPFASFKKMMMDSPPNDSPIANDLPPPPPALHEENIIMDSSQGDENPYGVSINGSSTITRPSAHARTKTKVPPHKARRSANTKLSSQAEVTAQLTGSGDAPAEDVKPVDGYSTATLVKKKATPPPPPKRSSTTAQAVAACPVANVSEASSVFVDGNLSSDTLPPPVAEANHDKVSTGTYDDDFDFTSIADPFKSSSKMMADSPPLPQKNAEMSHDDIDYDAIENPFVSSKKMMMDSPPNDSPLNKGLPPPPPVRNDNDIDYETIENPFANSKKIMMDSPPNDSPLGKGLPPPPPVRTDDVDFDTIENPFASSKKMMMDSPPNDSPIGKRLPPPPPRMPDESEIDFNAIKDPFANSKMMMLDSPDVEFPPPPTLEELEDNGKSPVPRCDDDVIADSHSNHGNDTSSNNLSADDVINGGERAADIRHGSAVESNRGQSHLEAAGFDVCNNAMDQLMNTSDNLPDANETEPLFPLTEQVTPVSKATKPSSKLAANSRTIELPGPKRSSPVHQSNQSSANNPDARDEIEENNNEIDSSFNRKDGKSVECSNTERGKRFNNSRGLHEDMKINEGRQETRLSNSSGVTTSNHAFVSDDDCDGLQPKLPYDEMFNQVSSSMLNERHAETLKELEALRQENSILIDEKQSFIHLLHDLEDAFEQVCVLKDKALAQRDEENIRLVKESEEAQSDIKSLEQSFDQAHKRYNKLRDTIEHYKQNEQIYMQEIQKGRHKIQEEEKMYQTLKAHTEERFREAERQSQEAEKLARGAILKLEMEQKKLLMANEALQLSYDQKVKEAQELNELCENLISKLAERNSMN